MQYFTDDKYTSCTARKKTLSLSRSLEKMVFPKKSRWNMIFLVLLGNMILLFRKNMIIPLKRKMKDDFSHEKYTEIYFLQTFWKDGLFKKGRAGTWCFLYYLERWYFFSRKHDIFSLGGKREMIFLKKYMEIWYFQCTHAGVTNVALRSSFKKIKDSLIP